MREIRLGLHAEGDAAAGWMRVLRQEKLAFDPVDGPSHPIILFDRSLPSWWTGFVEASGIAIVSDAPAVDAIFGPSVAATLNRFRPPESTREAVLPCLARLFEGDGEGEIRLHANRKAKSERLADTRPAVLTRTLGRGFIIYTGLPLATHLVAAGDGLRTFSDGFGLTERIANADKADIADTMAWMLRRAFQSLGLPYIRLSRHPGGARSVFLFRVDVDGLFGGNCRKLAEVARQNGIAGSFYVNASLCRAFPGELSRDWLAGHEIANHADAHDLFDTVEENHANLSAGLDWLDTTLGVRPKGYVAPRGMWNPALDRAMADLGHVYSSDFGLDIDSLPFFTPAGVLQVPVHPFSPERYSIWLEDAALGAPSARAVLDHYLAALERQVATGRPVHLYGHPEVLGRMADAVLPDLFAAVRQHAVPNMTVAAYADWWIARDKASLRLSIDEPTGEVQIDTSHEAVDIFSATPTHLRLNGHPHTSQAGGWTTLHANRETSP